MEKLIVEGIDLTDFLDVPYVAKRHPGNETIEGFIKNKQDGANCELFSLGVVSHRGFYVPQARSIELWHDEVFTFEIGEEALSQKLYIPFDLFFFLPKGVDPHKVEDEVAKGSMNTNLNELKKFHLAVYLGAVDGLDSSFCLLHLPKEASRSVIWTLEDFEESEKAYWLFKVKRPLYEVQHGWSGDNLKLSRR